MGTHFTVTKGHGIPVSVSLMGVPHVKKGITIMSTTIKPYGDNFTPVLRPGYPVIWPHTPEAPFCPDETCDCHEEDEDSKERVNQMFQDGIITADDATDIVMGRKHI